MSLPVSQSIIAAVQATLTEPVIPKPTRGGSLPLSLIRETLNVPTITVPVANHDDNNQHDENENIRPQNLRDGILPPTPY